MKSRAVRKGSGTPTASSTPYYSVVGDVLAVDTAVLCVGVNNKQQVSQRIRGVMEGIDVG